VTPSGYLVEAATQRMGLATVRVVTTPWTREYDGVPVHPTW
jgi:hypothetical protein